MSSKKSIGKYAILKTIGYGGTCKVKMAIDTETGNKVAIKVMNEGIDLKIVETEVKAMEILDHPNILKQLDYGQAEYKKEGKATKSIFYIALEYAGVGDLFDVVAHSGAFSEELTRFYFKRFLDGLQFCHERGVSHRDIKIENVLLDHNYELKINDFGFAAPMEGKDGTGVLRSKLGTIQNMAPEMHTAQPKAEYSGREIDIFASSTLLFTMLSAHPPFLISQSTDSWYRCVIKNKTHMFWQKHEKQHEPGFYSEEFKAFFSSMIQTDPVFRPSILELQSHPWMQGPVPTFEQVKAELADRMDAVMQAKKAERDQRRKERVDGFNSDSTASRDITLQKLYEKYGLGFDGVTCDKNLGTYVPSPNIETVLFSTVSPDVIEQRFAAFLDQKKQLHKVNEDKYKLQFVQTGAYEGGEDYEVHMIMRIAKLGDKQVVVEFQKKSGDQERFLHHFQEYCRASDAVLKDFDDSDAQTFAAKA